MCGVQWTLSSKHSSVAVPTHYQCAGKHKGGTADRLSIPPECVQRSGLFLLRLGEHRRQQLLQSNPFRLALKIQDHSVTKYR